MLATRLRAEYADVLRCSEHDREELAEYGRGLRDALEVSQAAREVLLARLDFLALAATLRP